MSRGRPPTTVQVCQEIHALLLESGIPAGHKVPRPMWDELVCRAADVTYPQSRNITMTGMLHGLWERHDSQGRVPGCVVLLVQPTAA